jgi:hypothetical protein
MSIVVVIVGQQLETETGEKRRKGTGDGVVKE